MKKALVLLALSTLFFCNCKKDDSTEKEDQAEEIIYNYVRETSFAFYVKDSLNNNLLNRLSYDDIDVMYEKGEVFYEPLYTAYKGYRFFNDYLNNNERTIWLYLKSPNESKEISTQETTTYIKIGDNEIDTIKGLYETFPTGYEVKKIWYNGELVVDKYNDFHTNGDFPIIIK